MWLSKRLSQRENSEGADKGKITVSSDGTLEANASSGIRNAVQYSPYGYSAAFPLDEEVFLIPAPDKTAVLGSKAKPSGLEAGEIKISSLGGASIVLKNDGRIILNGSLIIDRGGHIINGQ